MTEYNIGNGLNINNGKFSAPVDGIYYFYSQCRSYGSHNAHISFHLNGSQKSYTSRDEDEQTDYVTLSSQFKLNKGDTVCVRFNGRFDNPTHSPRTFFEGHLISHLHS